MKYYWKSFPHCAQLDAMDCGPSCLRMIAKYYGRSYSLQYLRERSYITRDGVSMLGISDAAESIGMRTMGVQLTIERLIKECPLPCILHWNQDHFVVCYKIKRRKNKEPLFYIADPRSEKIVYTESELKSFWLSSHSQGYDKGVALLLEPGPYFYEEQDEGNEEQENRVRDIWFFSRYLTPYKAEIFHVFLSMLTISVLQFAAPFLTQQMVDSGIQGRNLNIITMVLVAQLILFISQLSVGMIRSWIVLHMNARINIVLISDFLAKLMRLPIHFFDTKMVGDILQRIGDHGRIEGFLTSTSISTLFSLINFIVFGVVLAIYDVTILSIFLIGNCLYVVWVQFFMKYLRKLEIKRFNQAANEQNSLFQLITGMQEIKLNNCEREKRWEWERIQVKLFKISQRNMAVGQYQQLGAVFFSQITGMIITFVAAREVVNGNITLGMMMSLSFIIGQLSGPIGQIIEFITNWQYAKISLERLNEIHKKKDEDEIINVKRMNLPEDKTIRFDHVWFSYSGADRKYVLKDVCLEIPQGKMTAIVGASGSGKTTLIKLLLGFYGVNQGSINVGDIPLSYINAHVWRSHTGCVMQDGFLFSDTIARNIAVGCERIDHERLLYAARMSNLLDFVATLPLGFDTRIGAEGNGISQGQRQRVLIARAIYKNPDYLFFDEATNALDTKNEREISEHLETFFKGRTVVVAAHRLTTVRRADNIVVIDQGKVIEQGTHEQLVDQKGLYYELIKNQLELGN
jgi:ATP-binding cassette subfamily B protein